MEWMVGHSESAGLNRHVAGDARALQERRVPNRSWPRGGLALRTESHFDDEVEASVLSFVLLSGRPLVEADFDHCILVELYFRAACNYG
jgi:hypothetical protein